MNILACKSCQKDFDSDGLVYCFACREIIAGYNNPDVLDSNEDFPGDDL